MSDPIPQTALGIVQLGILFGTSALGLVIAYVAYRGYRLGSTPMFYVAIGFVLVFGIPFASFFGLLLFPTVPEHVFGLISGTIRFFGLVSILYGLRMPTKQLDSG